MKTLPIRSLLGASVCALLAGCGGTGGIAGDGNEEVRAREDGIYIMSDRALFHGTYRVETCFEGGSPAARLAVKTAVMDTWAEWTKLDFTGWASCPPSPAPIPITMVPINLVASLNVYPYCSNGVAYPGWGGRLIGSRYQVDINYCSDLSGLKATAVHELGHVIGLIHEHQRPDRSAAVAACEDAIESFYGGQLQFDPMPNYTYGTIYDPRSIMNYCRDWDNDGTPDLLQPGDDPWFLSQQDFMGAQMLYGWDDPGYDLPEGAFAWTQQTTDTFTADPAHSWSSAGLLPTQITRESTGLYRVEFPRQASASGNFQVSAFNSSNRCKVHDWTTSGTTQQLRVKCRTPSGSNADTRFVAKYQRRFDEPGWEAAYVYANQATASSYTATGSYSWNSLGWANTITRPSTGTYVVTLQGQEGFGGDEGVVDVTAVGTGNQYCVVAGYDDDNDGSEEVTVKCYTTTGTLANTEFMLSYGHRSMGASISYASVAANQPTASSYTPNRQRSFNACGTVPGPMTITRTATGRYDINFVGMWTSDVVSNLISRSTVKVTAWSSAGNYCNPWSWTAGNDTRVSVRCYNPSGSAVDSAYFVSLGTSYSGNCL